MTGYQSYTRTDIQTSDPRAVIVLLYEGAIRYLQQAFDAQRRDERVRMSDYILRTQKIIQFLANALDFDQGGELAGNLSRLYSYMRDTLSQANLHCDGGKIQEVTDLFRPLLEAWREIARNPAAAAALEARTAHPPADPQCSATPALSGPPEQDAEAAEDSSAPTEADALLDTGTYSPGASPQPQVPPRRPPNGKADVVIAGRAAYGLR